MSQYTIKVSETLTDNANYKDLVDIPADILVKGDTTVLVLPGTYSALSSAIVGDLAFIGIGDREEIVISGDSSIANTSTGSINFKNIAFIGSNASVTSGSTCVTKLGSNPLVLRFDDCHFSNSEFAIAHNGLANGTKQVVLHNCDATSVDKTIVANSNVGISYSALNTSSNAYFTPGTGGGSADMGPTVTASTSGGSNVGLNTETIIALIT